MSVNLTRVTFRPTSEVDEHEADHVVAAGAIVYATVIPEGNALGTTVPVKMTPATAAAAAVNGGRGTGHDQRVAELYLGVSWGQAKAEARAALAGKDIERKAVASALAEKGTIFQADVENALQKAEKVKKGIATVEVLFFDHSGRKTEYKEETSKSAEEIILELEEKEERHLTKDDVDLAA